MVRQVNKYFVCDTAAELSNIRFDDLEGTKAFVKSTPSEEYIYTAGNWQLISGGIVLSQIETVETEVANVPKYVSDGAGTGKLIVVSTTAPSSPAYGDIWFDIN